MNDTTQATALPPVDMEKRTEQFVKIRDLKAEIVERHKLELEPLNTAMEGLKEELKRGLDSLKLDSAKTACGTVSFTSKASASLTDAAAFWNYCVTQGNFDLIDKKANVTAVKDFVDKNGIPPPGVNYNVFRDVGVRRPTGK